MEVKEEGRAREGKAQAVTRWTSRVWRETGQVVSVRERGKILEHGQWRGRISMWRAGCGVERERRRESVCRREMLVRIEDASGSEEADRLGRLLAPSKAAELEVLARPVHLLGVLVLECLRRRRGIGDTCSGAPSGLRAVERRQRRVAELAQNRRSGNQEGPREACRARRPS